MASSLRALRGLSSIPARTAFLQTSKMTTTRPFASTPILRYPYKDDQDRESLKPRAQEYSKSGSDEEVAANEEAAFDPSKTRPEQEKEAAGKGNAGNPLETSPANQAVAHGGRGVEEDKTHAGKQRASGGGNAPKAGTAKSGH
jgi:hypothetical protein